MPFLKKGTVENIFSQKSPIQKDRANDKNFK